MRVELRPDIASRTSLGLGGRAAAAVRLEDPSELDGLPGVLAELGLRPFVLGAGTNILAHDGEHEICLVEPAFRGKPEILEGEGESVLVSAQAGLPLPAFLAFCRKEGLSGLEGLAGIPGSLGGAVAMNAGSFGVCLADRLASVDIWADSWQRPDRESGASGGRPLSADGRLRRIPVRLCETGYRRFQPPDLPAGGFFLVTGAQLLLERADPAQVSLRLAGTLARKRAVQPLDLPSAGCVFRNPETGPTAGQLLEAAGYRGRRLGGVALSEKHANFLVRLGAGSASEALALLTEARDAVAARFGVRLRPEVRELPCSSL